MPPIFLGTHTRCLAARLRPGTRPCVFFHGLGCTKEYFYSAFNDPSGTGRGLLALDLPGCGESDPLSPEKAYNAENQAARVREALIAAALGPVILVFHSLSSLLLPPLLREPENVSGVVLIEGNLIPEDTFWSAKVTQMDDVTFSRYFKLLQHGGNLYLRSMLKKPPSGEALSRLESAFGRSEERAFREWAIYGYRATQAGEGLHALAGYRGSKLYLRGEKNMPWGGNEILSRTGAAFKVIPESGHFPQIDNPEETYRAIFTF